MKIISLINSKGGVGKTTLTVNLSHFFSRYRRHFDKSTIVDMEACRNVGKVLLVDSDKRGSLRDWHNVTTEEKFADLIISDTRSSLSSLKNIKGYNYAFIDTPGYLDEVTIQALKISDLVLIPITPSPYDVWATEDIESLVYERQLLCNGAPMARYVLNRSGTNTKLAKEITLYLESLTKQQTDKTTIRLLSSKIRHREAFPQAAARGETIFHVSSAQSAITEINHLGDEIMGLLNHAT